MRLESDIQREILLRLGQRDDVRLWRFNVGKGWVRTGSGGYRPQMFGVPGLPDLMGVVTVRPQLGVWLGVEVKSERGRQSEAQRSMQQIMERAGAIYILARSADEAERALDLEIQCRR